MKYLFTLILSSLSLLCLAQLPSATEKARNVYYYKKGFVEVSTKDSADIIQIISEPDAGEKLYDVQEFYKSGSLYFVGKSSEIHPINIQGQGIYYYPNGSKEFVANYKSSWRTGETYHYYQNGKKHLIMEYSIKDSVDRRRHIKVPYKDSLYKFEYDTTGKVLVENGQGHYLDYNSHLNKIVEEGDIKNSRRAGEWAGYNQEYNLTFKEVYENGRLLRGESIDSLGNKYFYTSRLKPVDVPRGNLISRSLRYPAEARERNVQGVVGIQFSVSAEGEVSDYKIVHSVYPSLDAEAMRVIKSSIGWMPAEAYGKKITSNYVTPISFTLQGQ